MQSDKRLHFGKSNNDRKGSLNAQWPRNLKNSGMSKSVNDSKFWRITVCIKNRKNSAIKNYSLILITLHRFSAWWKCLEKCFKICHIFGIRKPKYFNFFFHFKQPWMCYRTSTVTNPKLIKMKTEKKLFGFSYSKNMANFESFL